MNPQLSVHITVANPIITSVTSDTVNLNLITDINNGKFIHR